MAWGLMLVALGFSLVAGGGCTHHAPADAAGPLRSMVQSARHPGLKWPDFSDYRAELQRLYERAGWKPLWFEGGHSTEAAIRLIAHLAGADSLGLVPEDYDAQWLDRQARELDGLGGTPSPNQLARFDLALSVAAVRFVSDLHRGRVSPRVVQAQLFIPRPSLAAEMAVDSLRDVAQQDLVLERVQPHFHHYRLLINGLARYRALAQDRSLVPLTGLPDVLKPGEPYSGAPRLRHLLEAIGDLEQAIPARAGEETRYSPDLVAGVKKFQHRQGFDPDGVIGPATAARLGRPFEQRVRQIELTLERWRWLPPSFAAPPIIVNIPAFRLYAFRGLVDREDDMLTMDVVVGGGFEHHTPVFAAEMKYVIFRPYWEVPLSIMKGELGPKALKDPRFLEREGMVLVSGESDRAIVVPPTRTNLKRIGKDLRLRQLPGPLNALGGVKFVLPNLNDVYLHDTPAKGLFAQSRRDFSHGCIRVSDPVALSGHVLRDQPQWTPLEIRAAMDTGESRRVNLTRPVPVYIAYATAIARESGEVYFYSDVYGLDEELDGLLRKGHPYPK